MKYFILLSLLFLTGNVWAIDILKKEEFVPSDLVGKTIVIPTYNNGDSLLHFVYNINVLRDGRFDYKNLSSVSVLGSPIKVTGFRILNQGKKKERLCLIVEKDDATVVLAFPMNIRCSEYTETLMEKLFYRENHSGVANSSDKLYSIKDINLHYYLADDIKRFNNDYLNKVVYLTGDDSYASKRKYIFAGFTFFTPRKEFRGKEHRFWVNSSFTYSYNTTDNADEMYAVLKGEMTVYVKIKENEQKPISDGSVSFSGLRKLVLDEAAYKKCFVPSIRPEFLDSINKRVSGVEFYFGKQDVDISGILLSKTKDFNQYQEIEPRETFCHYVILDGLKQIKTVDSDKTVHFDYFLFGKGSENGVFEDYVALPANVDVAKCLHDGAAHREMVRIEEQKRDSANRARIAQLDREEKMYRSNLVKKYGQANANIILNGEVKLGFTKAMCKEAWGTPEDINRTVSYNRTLEQWVYGIGCYLYFEGNKLILIQN